MSMDEKRIYKSRIGPELVISMSIIIGGLTIFMAYTRDWLGLSLIVVSGLWIAYACISISYFIGDRTLTIRHGFHFKKSIPIDTITKISETNDPIASPASSLINRIEIRYNHNEKIIISPKDKEDFIHHVVTINPKIDVKRKALKTQRV